MPKSTSQSSLSTKPSNTIDKPQKSSYSWLPLGFLLTVLLPVLLATLIYQLDSFDPAPMPLHELTQKPMFVPRQNLKMLQGSEKVGFGELLAPEDIAYDGKTGVIYTGCNDGWVKRVTVNDSVADSVVESWVNTGGRPLGLALGYSNDVIVADTDKGLLKVSEDGEITLLTDEAEGVKFKLTDAVVVAKNGMIYFTDASHKYSFHEFIWDILEGRPHGRLLGYDPTTKQTKVLVRDLYFANGVALSPDEDFVIFCETPLRRCRKFYVQGEREGSVDAFVESLPGVPDNIHYDDEEGRYWIGLSMDYSLPWHLALKYPFIRKVMAIMEKYTGRPHLEKNGGAIAVDLEGKPIELYMDQGASMISSGMKIGEHLYLGSIANPYFIRLNLTQYPAVASA